MPKVNTHAAIRFVCVFVSVVILGLFGVSVLHAEEDAPDDFSIHSEDSEICVKWDLKGMSLSDKVVITVSDSEEFHRQYEVPAITGNFQFKEGEHGKLYSVNVTVKKRNGDMHKAMEVERMFLVYDELPGIPLVCVSTYDGQDPAYDEAEKPDSEIELMGLSIVNNDYAVGQISYYFNGEKSLSTTMEIKCRGNTSALAYEKKPYKIKLPEPYDFGLDYSFKSTEWALINTEWNLNNFVGSFIGKECGLEWCPKGIFVNVILNGDWKGTYYLVQAVGIESANGIVDEDGFIVENDAYWWKEGEVSFRTDTQSPDLGFTFKYPVPSSESDPIAQRIRNHIQMVENSIINQDYQNVIDEKSFAKWILARDFMGIFDGGGANQYYYKKSMTDPGSLLKMGPLWDWESAYYPNAWSKCRLTWLSWFGFLFQYDSFQEVYRKEYEAVSRSLLDDLMKELDFLDQEYGREIEASWRLDSSRWKHDIVSFPEEKNKALEWFHDRIPWMDRYVYYDLSSPAQELDANSFQCVNEALSIVIDMEADFGEWKDFYGIYTDDKELLSNNCVIGYMSEEGKVYLANEIEDDEDLRKKYVSEFDQIVFDALVDCPGQLCLIDLENETIYVERKN